MTLQTASHFAQLLDPAASGAVVPERVQLIPPGTFTGRDGRGPYRIADMAAVIAASQADGPLIIDEGHSTDIGAASAPAFGRITGLEGDENGLWGVVRWNARGKASLEQQEYWGISPVFEHTPDGTVVRLLRASLTNIPNLRLAALNSQQEPNMTLLEQLRAALGLAATADEAAVVAHAKALTARDKAATEGHTALCAALKLDAQSEPAAVLTAVQAAQAAVQAAPQNTALQASHDKLAAEVETLKAAAMAASMARAAPGVAPWGVLPVLVLTKAAPAALLGLGRDGALKTCARSRLPLGPGLRPAVLRGRWSRLGSVLLRTAVPAEGLCPHLFPPGTSRARSFPVVGRGEGTSRTPAVF